VGGLFFAAYWIAFLVAPVLSGIGMFDYRWLAILVLVTWIKAIIEISAAVSPDGDLRDVPGMQAEGAMKGITVVTMMWTAIIAALYGIGHIFS
jgi:hypothetical protein